MEKTRKDKRNAQLYLQPFKTKDLSKKKDQFKLDRQTSQKLLNCCKVNMTQLKLKYIQKYQKKKTRIQTEINVKRI